MEEYVKPSLIESNTRYFLGHTLKQCRILKNNYISYIFNISMFVLFLILFGGILIYRYKGKLTPAEKEIKNRKKYEYIISKLQQVAYEKKRDSSLITDLPTWSTIT